MESAAAVESQDQLSKGGRQQASHRADVVPERHQLRGRDVAAHEVEDPVGPVERVEPDSLPALVHGEGDLGPILELLAGRNDLGVHQVEPGDAAERIAHEPAAGLALRRRVQVLELAAAAVVVHVVWAARLNPVGGGLQHTARPGVGVAPVCADLGDLDEVAGSGAGHEHRSSILQAPYPVAPGGEPEDANGAHRSPSSLAWWSQWGLA